MYDSKWIRQNPELVRQSITPKPFLGEENATDEWAQERKPVETFLHTSSYETFKRDDCLYLFGRRGTGKTAMIHMLQYEVRAGRIPHYKYAEIIDEEDAYHELSINVRRTDPLSQLPQDDLVYLLTKKWVWILNLSAMVAVVKAEYKEHKADKDLSTIAKYLQNQNLLDFSTNPIKRLSKIITEEFEAVDNATIKAATAFVKIINRLYAPDYEQAQKALVQFLKKSKSGCLVMVDSIQLYNLQDDIAEAVVTALIEATLRIYSIREANHILVKVAFPSELHPHFSPLNKEKTERKNVFILWRYRDLVSLLAKRYWQMIHKNSNPDDYTRLNDFHTARNFIYQHFPKQVTSTSNVKFDTLAYVIRHTQKKPRQVIVLFNTVLTLAEYLGASLSKITPELIVEGVHARLDMLVTGELNMYEQICPKAEQLVKRALTGARSHFDHSTLDVLLKEVNQIIGTAGLDKEDVKRLLLECGVIGIWAERHNLSNPKKTLLVALFEYQVKGTLTLTSRSQCVVHPMFYQELQIDVDTDTFTYPMPAEDEEMQVLADAGIQLGWDN